MPPVAVIIVASMAQRCIRGGACSPSRSTALALRRAKIKDDGQTDATSSSFLWRDPESTQQIIMSDAIAVNREPVNATFNFFAIALFLLPHLQIAMGWKWTEDKACTITSLLVPDSGTAIFTGLLL